MTSPSDLALFVERYLPVEAQVGEVVSISGSVVSVKIKGSNQSITNARIAMGVQAAAGCECYMVRHKTSPSWIVVAVYPPARAGAVDSQNTLPVHASAAREASNVGYYDGSFAAVNANTIAYTPIFTMDFKAKAETIYVGFSARLRFTTALAATDFFCDFTIFLDGEDVTDGVNPIGTAGTRNTTTFASVAFTYPIKGITPGLHTIDIAARQNSIGSSSIFAVTPGTFWVADA